MLTEKNRIMTNIVLVSLGAAVGANLRYWLSQWAAQQWGVAFPYGTLLINVLGSFAIGVVLTLAATNSAIGAHRRESAFDADIPCRVRAKQAARSFPL